jgi:hypothetical protein
MLKLFHVLDLLKTGIVVLQLLCVWLCILSLSCDVVSFLCHRLPNIPFINLESYESRNKYFLTRDI